MHLDRNMQAKQHVTKAYFQPWQINHILLVTQSKKKNKKKQKSLHSGRNIICKGHCDYSLSANSLYLFNLNESFEPVLLVCKSDGAQIFEKLQNKTILIFKTLNV